MFIVLTKIMFNIRMMRLSTTGMRCKRGGVLKYDCFEYIIYGLALKQDQTERAKPQPA
jgi:hypothetical protein